MIEGREDVRFAGEPSQPVRILSESSRKHFQRDVTLEFGIAGPIHFTHPTGAQRRDDLVRPEPGTGSKRHRGGPILYRLVDVL